jgi:glutamate formiminotransferase/formiminotetrahydrofolate cyclodeaminase
MKLMEQSLEGFSRLLAAGSPMPGGGSGAAVIAALGASFIVMVARISSDKPEFAERRTRLVRIADEADELRRLFLSLADKDSAAYARFVEAAGTPDAEAALRGCVAPPLEMLEGASSALRLARELSEAYYPPTASDIGIAALSLETAARGAYLTMHTNLKALKDSVFVREISEKSRLLIDSAETAASEIYDLVKRHDEN